MRKLSTKILSLIFAFAFACIAFAGCFSGGEENADSPSNQDTPDEQRQKLPTPEVAISYEGVAVWSKVEYALYYVYVISDGEEEFTTERSVRLKENETIKVKAISGEEDYADSDYSAPQKYIKVVEDEHTHTDVNSDGLCDKCDEKVTVDLSFYAVNDLHGKFMDTAAQPGVDEFTTYMKDLYADDAREEILLSSGDMWQGTVESSTNKGQLMTEWMNELDFVSMTLGNHEYDWGSAALEPNSQLADFPFLAINVTYFGDPVSYCQPSTIVERGGVKIGIIGAIGNCLSSISGDFTAGLEFATGSKLTSLVMKESTRLRKEEGCDFIVYSIHDGGSGFPQSGIKSVTNSDLSYYDTDLSDGYVDLVFEGHSHQRYILQDEYGVYHIQGGGENSGISCAEVTYNTVSGAYQVSPKIISNNVYASSKIKGDPVVEEIFSKYFPDSNPYTTVLGYNSSRKQSDDITSQLAKLYYQKGVEVWGKDYNIVLGGGYLNTRSPYYILQGDVHYADIFSVLPFDNEIVLGRIKGSNLKSRFLNGSYTCHATISASEVDNNKYYYIIVDSYTSTYRYNYIEEVARLGSGTYPRDLLADFISSGGWSR